MVQIGAGKCAIIVMCRSMRKRFKGVFIYDSINVERVICDEQTNKISMLVFSDCDCSGANAV